MQQTSRSVKDVGTQLGVEQVRRAERQQDLSYMHDDMSSAQDFRCLSQRYDTYCLV